MWRILLRGRLAHADSRGIDREGTAGPHRPTEPGMVAHPYGRCRERVRHRGGGTEDRRVAYRRRSAGAVGRFPGRNGETTRRASTSPHAAVARPDGPGSIRNPAPHLVLRDLERPIAAGRARAGLPFVPR